MTLHNACRPLRTATMLLALSALSSAGCGEDDNRDVFYVYVVNGYAGGGALSIYGNTGPLATGVEYGQISGSDGTPPESGQVTAPLKVDRRLFNGEIDIFLSGTPETVPLTIEAFEFYPGETVTLFLTRRSGPTEYELRVLRHAVIANQPSATAIGNATGANCVLQVSNGLSVGNAFTPNNHDIQLQFNFSTPPFDPTTLDQSVYNPMPSTSDFLSSCGTVPVGSLMEPARTLINDALTDRSLQMNQLSGAGWYYPVRGPSGALEYRVGSWVSNEGAGASIFGTRSTREFNECIASAVQVPVTEESNGMMPTCDPEKYSEIQVDAVRLAQCNQPVSYTGVPITPDSPEGFIFYTRLGPTAQQCNDTFRVRTRNVDAIFEPGTGMAADDQLATYNVTFPRNSWQHLVFFGTPINPRLYSFNSDAKAGLSRPGFVDPMTTPIETDGGTQMGGQAGGGQMAPGGTPTGGQ